MARVKVRAGVPLRRLAFGGLALAAVVLAWDEGGLADGLRILRTWALPVVVLCYLGAHGLRIVRTLVVLGDRVGSIRLVVLAHTSTALWTGLLPFKLGEVARMWAIGRASDRGGFGHGLRVVWVERTFDAGLIGLAAVLALLLLPESAEAVLPVAVLAFVLLVVTTLAVAALPENLTTAKGWLLGRYSTDWSNRVLRVLDAASDAVHALRRRVSGKVATLTGLTVGIWGLETAGMAMLLPSGPPSRLLVGMLAVLSGVLRPEGADEWDPVVAAWRGIVLGSAVLMAAGAVAGWEWVRRSPSVGG